MPIKIHIFFESAEIKPYATKLISITTSSILSVKKLLPLSKLDIVFLVNPESASPEIGGIGGHTPTAHSTIMSLDPQHPKFKSALTKELFPLLAHEFHHAIRWRNPGYGMTLFEALISEGLADHFVMEATGRKKPPLECCALTLEQKKTMLKRARQEWNKPFYNHNGWFYGSIEAGIPHWAGYTLGYDLVDAYLKAHLDTSASKLVSAPASLFDGWQK